MNRDKVLELAQKAKISIRGHYDETGSTPQELERFVALIEREVRKGAEPVAWMYGWDGKKHMVTVLRPFTCLDFQAWQLEKYDDDLTVYQRDSTRITIGDIRNARLALEAAKEAGL